MYTALTEEIEEVPRKDSWKDWLCYLAIFAVAAWFLVEFIFGADHLIEVISNWWVR